MGMLVIDGVGGFPNKKILLHLKFIVLRCTDVLKCQ